MATALTARQIAIRAIAGLVLGQVAVVAIDAAMRGPGPFVLFGL